MSESMQWKRKILSVNDENLIENRITELEKKYRLEVIIAILKASDPYPGAVFRFGICGVFILSLFFSFFFSFANEFYFLLFQFCLLLMLLRLGQTSWAKLYSISRAEVEREVQEKANELFFLKDLHEIKEKNSLLIMFSLQEKIIKIIPGPNLKSYFKSEISEKMLNVFGREFKNKKYLNGINQTLDILENDLIKTLPTQLTDNLQTGSSKNEYENKIIWGDFS